MLGEGYKFRCVLFGCLGVVSYGIHGGLSVVGLFCEARVGGLVGRHGGNQIG